MSLPQKSQLLKVCTQTVLSVSGAYLGPIHPCDLKFRLVNEQCMDRLIILQDLQRNVTLGFNWQYNYRIGCNWDVNGQQFITYNNEFYAVA